MTAPSSSARWLRFGLVSRAFRLLGGALPAALAVACSDPPAPVPPRPTLATSAPASEAFAAIRAKWTRGTREERVALEDNIRTLRSRHAREPVARLADLYLAWIQLERGDSRGAEIAAMQTADPSPGNTRDLSVLVRGASLGRQRKHDEALELLLPLVGRLLDAYARELLHEEAVAAGLSAHRWGETLHVLDAWHKEPDQEGAPPDARIDAALSAVPGTAVEAALDVYRDQGRLDDPFARRLATRLANLAVQRGDATLAQRLVQRLAQKTSDLRALGKVSESVLELAAVRSRTHVAGRTLGVVLSAEDEPARRRAASIAFGLERSGIGSGGERLALTLLLTAPTETRGLRDPSESGLDDASLRDLVRRGTVGLVGGDTPSSASKLARFAEDNEIAALLLAHPSPAVPDARWSFVSAPDDDGAPLLVAALRGAGASRVGVVGSEGGDVAAPCPDLSTHVHGEYPFAAWRQAGVDAVVLGGGESCALQALRALSALGKTGFRPRLALTLDAASLAEPDGRGGRVPPSTLVATVDDFPGDATAASRSRRAEMLGGGRTRLDVWTVRAHAIGVALRDGFSGLPLDDSAEETVVRARRRLGQGIFRELATSNAPRNAVTARSIPNAVPVTKHLILQSTSQHAAPAQLPIRQ